MKQQGAGSRPGVRLGCALGVVLAAAILLALLVVGPYTEYLWYSEDAGYVRVFILQYTVRGLLLGVALFLSWAVLSFGWRQALKFSFVYVDVPEGPVKNLTSIVMLVQQYGAQAIRVLSLLAAVLIGFGVTGEWQTYLLAVHGHSFHRTDPVFGWDYGFFVFELPWLEVCLGVFLSLALLVALVHGAVAIGLSLIQRVAAVDANLQRVKARAIGWLGVLLLIIAVRIGFSCFDYGIDQGAQFVGAGYTAVWQLKLTGLLAVMVAVLGVATLATKNSTIAWRGGAACGAYLLLVVGLFPAVLQRIKVEPDKNHVEAPYAQRAIDATRYAFDLNGFDVRNMPSTPEPTAEEVKDAKGTFDNMRLWDPFVLQAAIDQLQSFKQYYAFNDVDIDRYPVQDADGTTHTRMVMVSPRDISPPGLGEMAQTWVNTKLVYTHGYGVVVAPVNEANSLGQPVPLVGDIPVSGPAQFKLDYPQVYFSDFRQETGETGDSYAIVNTRVDEFDYPTQTGNATTRWKGTTGIHIDGLATRIAFTIALGERNLLFTNNLVPGSRLLLHRGVIDRASMLYPFLKFDRDPYIVVLGGRIVWVLDGYTSTDRIPYSQLIGIGGRSVNYIRNSVKVTVDAYTGQMRAYAMRGDDPILESYESIYPGLVHPLSEAPAELRAHFRYPEDLFSAQSTVLCTYHVTDPQQFLSNGDAWSIPNERGLNGEQEQSQPYYIQMRLPEDGRDEFLLIRGFTPYTRDNLSGWIAAHCDGDKYGKLTLYLFSKGDTVPGPWQVENLFVQDARVANVNRQFTNDQSKVVVGNLLVVPVGHSIVYAESLFLQGKSAVRGIPELRRVVLAVRNRIVMGDTYADALAQLFGKPESTPVTPAIKQPAPGTKPAVSTGQGPTRAELDAAVKALEEADAAVRRAKQLLEQKQDAHPAK
ncbi:MAG TPA: UPF0182 family protein [Fimbriimonadaceae bacterium]|nr:UPF0182 family protein [Fimbriimonadaceae bacterium]